MSTFRALSEEEIFQGYVIRVVKGTFAAPDGSVFERDVVHHPGAVAIVPLVGDDHGEIILVQQYRSALNRHILEIPAGLRDVEGEPLEQTARRELIEEIGMIPGSLELLTSVHNSVGFCDEQIHLFVGTDLIETERILTDSPEEHDMQIIRVPLLEAEAMIVSGEITDAKTIIGILAVLRR